ncbi:CPBP family intramembrane metalloprotease [Neorhizobium sp. P12A]|nr:CPBP family intramembrane metalloprotease [Neorhizobium sp. P12A]
MHIGYLRQIGNRHRLPISFVVLLLWAAILATSVQITAGDQRSVVQLVSQGVVWPIVMAVLFLAAILVSFRWTDIGFEPFQIASTLRLMWLPLLYLITFSGIVIVLGLPPLQKLVFIVINTIFVGISEEVMFRGILFSGLRSRFRFWPSIWLSCGLFGLIHVLNAVQTGNWTASTLQAIAAFQTGLILMALRVRTGSLYPVIMLHAVWDCLPLLIATHVANGVNQDQPLPAYAYLAPLFVTPNFLYALYLLRAKGLAKVRHVESRCGLLGRGA